LSPASRKEVGTWDAWRGREGEEGTQIVSRPEEERSGARRGGRERSKGLEGSG
jgi:hypothetical protein